MKRSIKCCGEMGMRQLSGSLAVHGWPQSWNTVDNQIVTEKAEKLSLMLFTEKHPDVGHWSQMHQLLENSNFA